MRCPSGTRPGEPPRIVKMTSVFAGQRLDGGPGRSWNLRLYPYKVSRARACGPAFPRSLATVRGEGMRSNSPPGFAHRRDAVAAGKVCQQSVADKAMGLPVGAAAPSRVTVTAVRSPARPEPGVDAPGGRTTTRPATAASTATACQRDNEPAGLPDGLRRRWRGRGRASGWGWRSARASTRPRVASAAARSYEATSALPSHQLRAAQRSLRSDPANSNCWARASSRISAKWCPAVRGQRNPDGFRFCGSCGSLLEDLTADGREVRKTITVVFCDLAGSTALGERLDPESPAGAGPVLPADARGP